MARQPQLQNSLDTMCFSLEKPFSRLESCCKYVVNWVFVLARHAVTLETSI